MNPITASNKSHLISKRTRTAGGNLLYVEGKVAISRRKFPVYVSSSTYQPKFFSPDTSNNSISISADAQKYVNEHRILREALPEIREAIDKFFGENKKIKIRLFADPDDRDNLQLLIVINTTLTSDEAYSKLNRFDHNWWFKQPSLLRKRITITIGSK